MHESELANGSAQRVPAGRVPLELDEQAPPCERGESLGGVRNLERLAQLDREPLQRRDAPDERLDLRRLVREDLRCEILEQRPSRPAHSVECGRTFGWIDPTKRLDRKADGRWPSAGYSLELRRDGRFGGAGERLQQGGGLVAVEREL